MTDDCILVFIKLCFLLDTVNYCLYINANENKLSIIIPAYNEKATIYLKIDKIKSVQLINGINKEIIIVYDCSTDNTKQEIYNYISQNKELDVQYFEHEVNKGKGVALHTGIKKYRSKYENTRC